MHTLIALYLAVTDTNNMCIHGIHSATHCGIPLDICITPVLQSLN